MTLVELCEPLFQYVCRLNRLARKAGHVTPDEVRAQVKGILADMRAKAGGTPGLAGQYEKVELVLIFFVDSMVRESGAPFARQWSDLAQERNELAGDEKFFDLLEETLADKSEAATDRLAVFYTCLGLGFTGWYTGQPEFLRKKMAEIFARVRGRAGAEASGNMCPDAYEHVNTSDLIEPPGRSLVGFAIALLGLIIVLFAANVVLYQSSSKELDGHLQTLIDGAGARAKP